MRLARGWRWEGRSVKPVTIDKLATTEKNTLDRDGGRRSRGRARSRRAGDLIRHTVLKISRIRLGGLSFEGLAMGGWRDLTKGEVSDLRSAPAWPEAPANVAARAGFALTPALRRVIEPRPVAKEKSRRSNAR